VWLLGAGGLASQVTRERCGALACSELCVVRAPLTQVKSRSETNCTRLLPAGLVRR
jgi:hypothetical protein